ncbi:MAG TPA: hypothetical protein VIS47_02425 [Nitrosopumilus sp.]
MQKTSLKNYTGSNIEIRKLQLGKKITIKIDDKSGKRIMACRAKVMKRDNSTYRYSGPINYLIKKAI